MASPLALLVTFPDKWVISIFGADRCAAAAGSACGDRPADNEVVRAGRDRFGRRERASGRPLMAPFGCPASRWRVWPDNGTHHFGFERRTDQPADAGVAGLCCARSDTSPAVSRAPASATSASLIEVKSTETPEMVRSEPAAAAPPPACTADRYER